MLQRRGQTYTSRVIIPADLQAVLGRVEITRSLRTGRRPEALRRLALWESHIQTYLAAIRRRHRTMTRAELDALTRRYLEATFDEIEERLAGPWSETSLDVRRWDLNDEAHQLSAALAATDCGPGMEEARRLLPEAPDDVLRRLARRLIEVRLEATKAELEALNGKSLRMPELGQCSFAQPAPSADSPAPTRLLSEVVTRYSEERISHKNWTQRTAAQYREIYYVIVDLLGDREIGAVRKADIRQLGLDLARFPSNQKKIFPGLTPTEALRQAGDDPEVARLAPASVNMYQQAIRSLFLWAVENDETRENPSAILKDRKVGKAKDDRLPFTDEDLKAYFIVLDRERNEQPWLYWIPRIMAFTGCRLGEAARLCKEDVREQAGVWVVDINEDDPDKQLKTDSSVRRVPIHPRLKEMGFLNFVAEQASGFLWPADLRKVRNPERSATDKLSRRLATRLRSAGITHPKKTGAHSFRHTVSHRLKDHSVPEYQIAEILGHEDDGMSTGRYGSTTNLARLYDIISLLQLPI